MQNEEKICPVTTTLRVIGGRWKALILYHLFQDVKRFSELQHAIGGVSQKVLTQQLRELERDGIIHREVFPQVPPRVEYSMTALGESLKPVVGAMGKWGMMFRNGELKMDGPYPSDAKPAQNAISIHS